MKKLFKFIIGYTVVAQLRATIVHLLHTKESMTNNIDDIVNICKYPARRIDISIKQLESLINMVNILIICYIIIIIVLISTLLTLMSSF